MNKWKISCGPGTSRKCPPVWGGDSIMQMEAQIRFPFKPLDSDGNLTLIVVKMNPY